MTEKETRILIDKQLREVGWEADSENLKYSKGTRPQKGRNIAIAEWPTDSNVCKYGSADYALFIGLQLFGVIEAKAKHVDIPSVIDYQCRDYSIGIRKEDDTYIIETWGEYKAPFLFATNGREYLQQFETKSGIWFRDARKDSNISRALKGWISPQGLIDMFERDIDSTNKKLAETTYDVLLDKDGLNLRPYQIEAIEKAEEAIVNGKQTVLLAMATGTGKTRTVMGMIYRFLNSQRFKRILFLIDRNVLGRQAFDVFNEIKIEELMTLNQIFPIKNLGESKIDYETKIQIATVQSLVKRIHFNKTDTKPSIADYDLIIVDEAHRGYFFDKEMDEDEEIFRDQQDFMSKYRSVIEYFDSVKIALTATPAQHTSDIFGMPVYEYTYRRAVVEGYLCDHDLPHKINTKLQQDGINYKKGETVAIYDPVTGEITNSGALEDDLNFDIDNFNRQVITEDFNRTVLKEIAKNLNPIGDEKTLIYAVDDTHADLIVKILREIYEPNGISNEAIMKITGKVGGGNPKKVEYAVKLFKNEKNPRIAVTVDLLTTGIDVPQITTLVFIRRVKSRILFEQMLGRATRLCPEINKTHFEIYDAVGVYDSLESVSNMKPVSQKEFASFDDLVNGLKTLKEDKQLKKIIDMIAVKARRKNRLSVQAHAQFEFDCDGLNPLQFANRILSMPVHDAKDFILKRTSIFKILDEGQLPSERPKFISDKADELVSHTRGYGQNETPQDYLEEFSNFIKTHKNKIAALKVVCTKPSKLTRNSLKSLKMELDKQGFTDKRLNTAWKEVKNEDIGADIISYIRRFAIGSPLINHEIRIKNAVEKLKTKHEFTKMELDWLKRFEKTLLEENVIDRDTFDTGAYKTEGKFERINKLFNGKLDDYIKELNEYLYDDGEKTA